MSESQIKVEVAYALDNKQIIIPLDVDAGTSMYDAVINSGIAKRFPEIDLENLDLGIFGKAEKKFKERVLKEGERVEIYRPLTADPKEVRKKRAAEAKAKKESQ